MLSNLYHPDISALPAWQQDYIREFKRGHGKSAGFAYCKGGWYALYKEGDESALKLRVRRADVQRMTGGLRAQPDFVAQDATPRKQGGCPYLYQTQNCLCS